MNQEKYLTVTALTKYLKFKFDSDENLKLVFLKGEISNLKFHSTGHIYFSLKDETSKINAIMFNNNASKLKFNPKDGGKVLVVGRISLYEATGNYQIYVDEMLEDGIGDLYKKFEELKEKLSKEGLFNEEHKKEIPKIPKKIGIITAPTGAAIKDIISTIKRRYPICETILFPCLVQGELAKEDIVKQINEAQNYDLDLLIVGRGGGSIEDLWAFNEECVAYAIYNSHIPIISAVGHEIDFTIADFVADLRAPTPTGASEMAVPNIADLNTYLNQINIRLTKYMQNKITLNFNRLNDLRTSYVLSNPLAVYEMKEQYLTNLFNTLNSNIVNRINLAKTKYNHLNDNYILDHPEDLLKSYQNNFNLIINKLELLNPLAVLAKGYSVVTKDNVASKTAKELKEHDLINIKLYEGSLSARVESVGK